MKRCFKVFFILIIFLFGMINCKASVVTFDRNELKNYGVNKKWKITDKNKSNVMNTKAVDASEKIYDFSDILTDSEEQELKLKIDEFIKETNMDMVIVTDEFNYYNDEENEVYAADFYDYNDFGINYDKYSGVLLLRNTNPSDKYYNIYTFGDAQLYFSYERLENTLDDIYFDFTSPLTSKNYGYSSDNDEYLINDVTNDYGYYKGMLKFINDMETYYKNGIPSNMKNYKVDDNGYLYEVYKAPWLPITILSIIVTMIVMGILIKKNKMIVKATNANNYYVKDSLKIINRVDSYVRSHTSSYTRSSSSSSGGGRSSSGGSSGGGHSSGGGRHG